MNLATRLLIFELVESGLDIWKRRKANKEREELIARQKAAIDYLIHIINENEVELTEFDLIAWEQIRNP